MKKKKYTSKNIKYFKNIEHIRKRPSMYIGDININGLHHILYEVLNNSLDEYSMGFCNQIFVIINNNKSITIEDNGRGIPIDIYKKKKKSALEIIMTKIGSGGKFDKSSYKFSSGLHGVGLSCVNALSKKLVIKIYRNNLIYKQKYYKGNPLYNVKVINKNKIKKNGTKIKYTIDDSIFKYTKYNYNLILKYLEELSFLNKNLKFFLYDKRTNNKKIILSSNGLKDFIDYLDIKKKNLVIKKDFYLNKKIKNKIYIELIIRFKYFSNEKILSYVNNIKTINGGTHVIGLKKALIKTFKKYIYLKKNNDDINININNINKDIIEGILAILSIKLNNPEFEGQTKNSLANKDIIILIEEIINFNLNIFLEENPIFCKKLINKILINYKARNMAKKIKENIQKKNINLYKNIIPNKFSDCTYDDPNKCEIFLVEGDSAGGTAKQGRNRKFQAILPLKGKILNVEKTIKNKFLDNNEIKNIFSVLNVFLEKKNCFLELNIKKLKYKKIIIMTDADIDGKHISTLILTFLFKCMRILINKGYVYIANPPLYMIKKNKKKIYIWNELEKKKIIDNNKNKKIYIQRYKGLGEMNSNQLWDTTMNPKKRFLKRIYIKNFNKSNIMFNILMGENILDRKKFIKKNYFLAKINI
ncbi:MAG: toprim domain-containing protein [Candidatus Shikimatogenerans bostrichidophilus]|nr:MAG: toprim domain-containing protein [Candidatus Shikimatogenerans bostrichidophilus]